MGNRYVRTEDENNKEEKLDIFREISHMLEFGLPWTGKDSSGLFQTRLNSSRGHHRMQKSLSGR